MRLCKLLLVIAALGLITAPTLAVPFEDFDTPSGMNWLDYWIGAPYYCTANLTAPGVTGKGLALTEFVPPPAVVHSANSLIHGCKYPCFDWSAYSTLEFDAKISTSNLTGYSIRLCRWDEAAQLEHQVLIRAIPFTAANVWQHFRVDISGIDRSNIIEITIYINRSSQSNGQTVTFDNLEVTNNPAPAEPNEVMLDNFDTYGSIADMYASNGAHPRNPSRPWDWLNGLDMMLQTGSGLAQSAPNCADLTMQTGLAQAAYAERAVMAPLDIQNYNSIVFDAKVIKGLPHYRPAPSPMGFQTTVLGTNGNKANFYKPDAYDTWQTFRLPINGNGSEQLLRLYFHSNLCQLGTAGETLRIDNIRFSKDPGDPVAPTNPLIADFEDGDLTWWYYSSYHDFQGTRYEGVSRELVNGGAGGSAKALKLTNLLTIKDASVAQYPYCRKTILEDWSGYITLQFDARIANSVTDQGFTVAVRQGPTNTYYKFYPGTTWGTFKANIAAQNRYQVTGLLFYINRLWDDNLTTQSRNQELYLDNIKLTNEPAATAYDTIAAAKKGTFSGDVTINSAVVTGVLLLTYPDKDNPQNLRSVFFIEDTDRTAAVPVVWDGAVAAGDKVNVVGMMREIRGTRVIYATSVTANGTGTPAKPLIMTNKVCGDLSGIDTSGMLVTITGQATSVETDALGRNSLYIDDGSSVLADTISGTQKHGVKVVDSNWALTSMVGHYVTATGFAMQEQEMDPISGLPTGRMCRALWPKMDDTGSAMVRMVQ